MNKSALGIWYCDRVNQEQSAEADEFDEGAEYYDDQGGPQKASETEFAGTTLELFDDGRYGLKSPADYADSFGTWSEVDGHIRLQQSDDCVNGMDGMEYANDIGDRFVVAFKLVPDAHDGLDVLVLGFGRQAPQERSLPEGFVEQILAAEDENEVYEALDTALGGDHARERARELWDAWMAGRLAADREAEHYWLELEALRDERTIATGAFTHAHAKHALVTLDPRDDWDLCFTVQSALGGLAKDDLADAELAPLLKGDWLDRLVASRFIGGGLPAEFFQRKLVPQPDTDDAARAYLERQNCYTRFEEIPELFPKGHPDFPSVAIRYRGPGLLTQPLALVEKRGLAAEVRGAAIAWLEDPANRCINMAGLGATMWAVFLACRLGEPLPALVVDALGAEVQGMIMGALSDDEKAMMGEAITALPEEQQAKVRARFYL